MMQLERKLRRVGEGETHDGRSRHRRHGRGQEGAARNTHALSLATSFLGDDDTAQLRRDGRSSLSAAGTMLTVVAATCGEAGGASALLSRERCS